MAIRIAGDTETNDADHGGRIPTLPFGTKRVVQPTAIVVKDSRIENSFVPFRFFVPELPGTLEHGQRAATPLPDPSFDLAPASSDSRERTPRRGWMFVLGAIALGAVALTLVVWSVSPNGEDEVTRSRSAAPDRLHLPHIAVQPAILAQAVVPAVSSASAAAQSSAPLEAANATNHPKAPLNPRAMAAPARVTLKRQSVLASVLAPPPAD